MITVTSPPSPADARAGLAQLLAQASAADGHEALGEAKVTGLGRAEGLTLVADDDGDLVGWAQGRWGDAGAVPRLTAEFVTAPTSRRDVVAAALLDAVEAQLATAGGGTLYVWRHRVLDAAAEAPATRGYAIQRELAVMARPLDPADAPAPAAPDGITIRPFRPGLDDEAVVEVNNAAFAGHPEQGGWTVDDLTQKQHLPWFDPAGFLLAWSEDRLLGFHWTKEHGDDDGGLGVATPHGEVYVLGVHPEAQGRGIARALLDAGLAHLAARGNAAVSLYVDRANAAAVRLYERGGFRIRAVEVCYETEVSASPASAAGASGSSL